MSPGEALDLEIQTTRSLIRGTAGAAAQGFDEVLERLERLEGAVFGREVNGFEGAPGVPAALTLIPRAGDEEE